MPQSIRSVALPLTAPPARTAEWPSSNARLERGERRPRRPVDEGALGVHQVELVVDPRERRSLRRWQAPGSNFAAAHHYPRRAHLINKGNTQPAPPSARPAQTQVSSHTVGSPLTESDSLHTKNHAITMPSCILQSDTGMRSYLPWAPFGFGLALV